MPTCVIKSCKNRPQKFKKSEGITYHTFPRKILRKAEWVQIIRACRNEKDWNPSSASTVCSAHFDEEDFKTSPKGLRLLKRSAVPKRLLSCPCSNETTSTSSEIEQIFLTSSNIEAGEAEAPSTSTELEEENLIIVKSEPAEHCRLCASESKEKLLDLQSDTDLKSLVDKMLNRLNNHIDFDQEYLPAKVCVACAKTLYTAYDLVGGIDKAHVSLNTITNAMATGNGLQKSLVLYSRATQTVTHEPTMPESGHPHNNLDLPSTSSNYQTLLSCPCSNETTSTSSEIEQIFLTSSNIEAGEAEAPSTSTELEEENLIIVKSEPAELCRLCASESKEKLLDLQSDTDLKSLVDKMLNRLNNHIDFDQEYLPAKVCVACAKTLYTAYDFVGGIDRAQVSLNTITNAMATGNGLQKSLVLSSRATQTVTHEPTMPESGHPHNNLDLPRTSSNSQTLLSCPCSNETTSTSSEIEQIFLTSSNIEAGEAEAPSTSTELEEENLIIVKSEPAELCRLCASESKEKLLDLQSDTDLKSLVDKMLNRLNNHIDFDQEYLPAKVCVACAKTLYTAYDFVGGIDRAQVSLNTITNAMATGNGLQKSLVLSSRATQTVTHEPTMPESGHPHNNLDLPRTSSNSQTVSPNIRSTTSNMAPPSTLVPTASLSLEASYKLLLNYTVEKKTKRIENQKRKIKSLNQKIRRLVNRNKCLKKRLLEKKKERVTT